MTDEARTRARQQITLLFDHLVGVEQEVVRDDKAQSLRRLEVDDEFEFRRLFPQADLRCPILL